MRYALAAICFALTMTAAHAAALAPPLDRDATLKANEQAKAENALIVKAMAALKARKWQEAETLLLEIAAVDPANWQVERSLGSAKLNLGKYDEAVAAFDKAIKLAEAAAKATPPDAGAKAELGSILTAQGNAYLKLKKTKEAVAAFERAAALDPHPATAYFNLCATQYNSGDVDGALKACDRAIAADPKKADAYFIKGSLLFGNATLGADGKMAVPGDALKALRKYLQLEPNGAHAADVKAMFEAAGQPVTTTYKPKGK
jgi:tetratricopeptide (TPR) repeat protein